MCLHETIFDGEGEGGGEGDRNKSLEGEFRRLEGERNRHFAPVPGSLTGLARGIGKIFIKLLRRHFPLWPPDLLTAN
jgi:hypothetical protein